MSFAKDGTATGGKGFYGASVGILMLETRFPRITGEVGNANTWDFPVHYKVVRGASVDRVVRGRGQGLLDKFIDAAREAVSDGVDGITTNCGFLSLFQDEIAEVASVPVATSSLMQAQVIQSMLGKDRRVGIITFSAADLSADHLEAARVPDGTPVVGIENGEELFRVIMNDEEALDVVRAEQDLLDAADHLVNEHPDVGAILLECTNMSPYSAAIAAKTGLPVYDIVTFVNWFHGGLRPRNFGLAARSGRGFTDA